MYQNLYVCDVEEAEAWALVGKQLLFSAVDASIKVIYKMLLLVVFRVLMCIQMDESLSSSMGASIKARSFSTSRRDDDTAGCAPSSISGDKVGRKFVQGTVRPVL